MNSNLLGTVSFPSSLNAMTTIEDVERAALAHPERERALIALHLLHSLREPIDEEDLMDPVALAQKRDAELDADAAKGMSLEEFEAAVAR